MKRLKINWKKIIAIAIICAIIDIIIHALWAPLFDYDYPASYLVKNGLFIPAAAILLTISYVSLVVVFVFIQEKLSGGKLSKGFRFGISFGGLWFIAMPGASIFFGSPMMHELLTGLLDGLALLILGLLLGMFVATDNNHIANKKPKGLILPIIVITIFFIIGQYLAFIIIGKHTPHFSITGTATFIWTLALGLWMGVMYCLLKQGIKRDSSIKWSFGFSGVIIGINWLYFNFFIVLILDVPLLDPLILAGLNILSVAVGVFVFETFIKKDTNRM